MKRWPVVASLGLIVVAVLALAAAVRADELPPGAIAMLGTHTFRHDHTVSALSFSADGKRLASAGWDQTARVWDVATGREISRFSGHEDSASAVAISPDGRLVASGDMKKTLVLWDANTGKEIHRLTDNANTVFWLRFTADGKRLIWTSGKAVRIWDVVAWREVLRIDVGRSVRPVVLSPDGQMLAVGGEGGSIEIRRVADGALLKTLEGNSKGVFALAFHPDGKRLLSGESDSTARLWDVTTGAELQQIELPRHWVHPVAFVNGGRQFVAGRQDGTVGVWETDTAKPLGAFTSTGRRDAWTMVMAVSPDGKTLATSGTEFAIRLWDTTTFKPLDTPGHTQDLVAACFGADGKSVITAAQDGQLRFWDAATGQPLRRLDIGGTLDVRMAPSADAKHLAIRCDDDHLFLCDVEHNIHSNADKLTASQTVQLPKSTGGANSVALSPDGRLVSATCGHDTVHVIDTASGDERFVVHTDPRQWAELPMAFSPDNRLLAIGSGDPEKKFVTLVDTASGHAEGQLPVAAGGDGSLAFSGDGASLAIAGRHQPIRLVELASRRVRAQFPGDGDAGTCLALSPDGRLLAAGGGPDKPTIRVWDLRSGKQIYKFTGGHTRWLKSVAFSPDSKRLVSAGRDTVAMVWDVSGADEKPVAMTNATDPAALSDAWTTLAGDDAAAAYQAIQHLALAGDGGVEFLAAKLTVRNVDGAADDAHVAALVAALDADRYADREAARKALADLGQAARPALRKALAQTPSAEARTRIEVLLAGLNQLKPSGELIRDLRAVEALRMIHTPKAAEALRQVATTHAGTRVAQAARFEEQTKIEDGR